MSIALSVHFVAPIPVGHRVQIVRTQYWTSPLFGGAPYWEDLTEPILVDLETGILYCTTPDAQVVIATPFGFKPNSGRRVSSTMEARVTSCVVSASGGDHTSLRTDLMMEPTPQGYRQ